MTYSPTRARNDTHKRDKTIEKLQKKLKRSRKPASFSSRGYGRFLSFPGTGDVTIDEALIKDAAKWDGLHAILIHGADDQDTQDVIARYHQLWEIEACFSTNKHDLIYRYPPCQAVFERIRNCDRMQSFIRPQSCGYLMTAGRYGDAQKRVQIKIESF